MRTDAFEAIFCLSDALMLYHHAYFKKGVKKMLQELERQNVAREFLNNMVKITKSKDIQEIRNFIRDMIVYAEELMRDKHEKAPVSMAISSRLTGTYEEMYSNWKNKVQEAAESQNSFSSFMSVCAFAGMINDISADTDIGSFDISEEYNPDCLEDNVKLYDRYLKKYDNQVYEKASIKINEFENVDEFVRNYLKS